jgi:4-amino-4-deoxychorismate lyase
MLVNGQHQNLLPVADRSVQYGDGVFETILVRKHRPVYWQDHLDRLIKACRTLQIPLSVSELCKEVETVLAANKADGALKIIITRGSGGRGYGAPATPSPTRIVQMHPLPLDYPDCAQNGVRLFRCQHPLSRNAALAGIKHLNRLDQVMASLELPVDAEEGLMCDETANVIEGIKSNVFAVVGGKLITPDLSHYGVAGVMRGRILALSEAILGIPIEVTTVGMKELRIADEIFVCNSVLGIWPVTELFWDAETLNFAIGPISRRLQTMHAESL